MQMTKYLYLTKVKFSFLQKVSLELTFQTTFTQAFHFLWGRSSCGCTLKSSRCVVKQMGLIHSTVELIRLLSSIIQLEAL